MHTRSLEEKVNISKASPTLDRECNFENVVCSIGEKKKVSAERQRLFSLIVYAIG